MAGRLVGIVTRTKTRFSPRDFASWLANAGYLAREDMFEASPAREGRLLFKLIAARKLFHDQGIACLHVHDSIPSGGSPL